MNQRIKLTKRLLKESLLGLLTGKDVDQITIKELCTEAGINRSTFYTHYGTVRDVMTDIENDIMSQISTICHRYDLSLKNRMIKICEYLHQNRETELILFRNCTDSHLVGVFRNMDQDLQQMRYDASGLSLSPDEKILMSAFINFGIFYLIKTWLIEDIQKSPEEITDIIFDRILRIK